MSWIKWFRPKTGESKPSVSGLREFLRDDLGISTENIHFYEQAFRHVTVTQNNIESNERLEFIGDAVLDAVVAAHAYARFPEKDEGHLSKVKSAVVNRQTLNKLARDMQLESYIQAKVSNRQAMHVIGGNVLEAFIGAIFIDKGFDATRTWVEKYLIARLDMYKITRTLKDPKSRIFEISHQKGATLEFEVSAESGDNVAPFTATVIWNGQRLSSAESSSKKGAEQKAARKALEIINPS